MFYVVNSYTYIFTLLLQIHQSNYPTSVNAIIRKKGKSRFILFILLSYLPENHWQTDANFIMSVENYYPLPPPTTLYDKNTIRLPKGWPLMKKMSLELWIVWISENYDFYVNLFFIGKLNLKLRTLTTFKFYIFYVQLKIFRKSKMGNSISFNQNELEFIY